MAWQAQADTTRLLMAGLPMPKVMTLHCDKVACKIVPREMLACLHGGKRGNNSIGLNQKRFSLHSSGTDYGYI